MHSTWNRQRPASSPPSSPNTVPPPRVVGVVLGVDHAAAFNDPDNGCSLWALAIDPTLELFGVGEALVRHVIRFFAARGRHFLDLSVVHSNEQAIHLYRKLGFQQVPAFCLKNRNSINERLFMGRPVEANLNIYARIITDEARRRGVAVDVIDEEAGYFSLEFGGRTIVCRESLSELTSAIAMDRCADKAITLRLLARAGLPVPDQILAASQGKNERFLRRHRKLVVKPLRGEQGQGISVGVTGADELEWAVEKAGKICDQVLLEQFIQGDDLRIIVIGGEVVAAAIRRPASIRGDGVHDIRTLIEKQSRRRAAATDGESRIPLDGETRRCVKQAGYKLDHVPKNGRVIRVRNTANLHTGGTIHDVTDHLHPCLMDAAVKCAEVLAIPVVGLDFLVTSTTRPEYVVIEANERPGLANHEPQPTVERFLDLLFPQTRSIPELG